MPEGFANESFVKIVYCAFGGAGDGSSVDNPLPIQDQNLWPIPAKCVIQNVDVIVQTSLTGTTQLDIGDADDPNGFVAAATLTAGAPVVGAGAYIADRVTQKKYTTSGKYVAMENTTTNTAGALAVVIKGYRY